MEMKRFAAIAAVIILALGCYSYLIGRYNPGTVEFYIKDSISYEELEKLKADNSKELFNMNYIMTYKGNKLIMTTGMDAFMKELILSEGCFIADINVKESAIGDEAAEELFRNSGIVGQLVDILGEEYEIRGILKRSKEVYIPFSEKLRKLPWQKRILRCSINDGKLFYLKLEGLQKQLESLGIDLLDVVVYREEIDKYRNIAIIAGLYILAWGICAMVRRIKDILISLRIEYLENRRVTELMAYIKSKSGYIWTVLGFFLAGLVLSYVFYKLFTSLRIPPFMIPDNLFSPSSYLNIARLIAERYLVRLENGIEGILVSIALIDNLAVLTVFCTIIAARKSSKIKKLRTA